MAADLRPTQREKAFVCADHGPDCENPNHGRITLDLWRCGQGLCGECGGPGTIAWGVPGRIHTLRCGRCCLVAQIEHARERAAALPELEAQLDRLTQSGQDGG